MFAFAILHDGADPIGELQRKVTDYGYELAPGGDVFARDDKIPLGLRWRAAPLAEFAERPWHAPRTPCPWLPPLAAYVVIEPIWDDLRAHPELRLALVREGKGGVARLDDDRARPAVGRRRFTIATNLHKWGFEDGDALLFRNQREAYLAEISDAIEAAARAAGYTIHLTWIGTCHNPIREGARQDPVTLALHDGIWRLDGRGPYPLRKLGDAAVEIWAYAFDDVFDEADGFWDAF